MRGFYNITERIRLQLAADEYVNTVTYGDIFRVDLKKQTLFPLSHVVVNNATMENNVWRYNISIMAMDIVDISKEAVTQTAQGIFRGNDNEQDVLNTQFAVLNRLLEVLRSGDIRNELYQLDGNPNLEPFTERFENFLAGWVATFDVLIPNDMTACDATVIPSVICEDATAITTDSEGNQLYSNTIPSGGTLTQPISDSVVTLKDTALNVLSITNVLAEGVADITAPDSTYLVEYVNGTDIQSGSIVSGGSVTVTVPNPIVCSDTTIEVNGTIEGTVTAGSTVDIQLSDSGGVVTPTSVTQVGNDLQIVLPDGTPPIDPEAQAFITAASISDSTQQEAINMLVGDLKFFSIWDKMKAIYPMIGGNSTAHSYNLRNVAQYQLSFVGGWTHSATGAQPNGVNAYADTGLNISTQYTNYLASHHLSIYSLNLTM